MEKTRDPFKKIRDTKGIFHAKMYTIKDRNGRDLIRAEDIQKSGKNKQNYTKKIFMTQKPQWCDHSSRARHLGMQSHRKHHYKQSYWR